MGTIPAVCAARPGVRRYAPCSRSNPAARNGQLEAAEAFAPGRIRLCAAVLIGPDTGRSRRRLCTRPGRPAADDCLRGNAQARVGRSARSPGASCRAAAELTHGLIRRCWISGIQLCWTQVMDGSFRCASRTGTRLTRSRREFCLFVGAEVSAWASGGVAAWRIARSHDSPSPESGDDCSGSALDSMTGSS
jgi:hypothetical protein